MSKNNGRKTTIQRAESSQDVQLNAYCFQHSEAGSTGVKRKFSKRSTGKGRQGNTHPTFPRGSLAGGIVTKLIDSELDRLGELKEDAAQYEQELRQAQIRLNRIKSRIKRTENRLKDLQALQQSNDDG